MRGFIQTSSVQEFTDKASFEFLPLFVSLGQFSRSPQSKVYSGHAFFQHAGARASASVSPARAQLPGSAIRWAAGDSGEPVLHQYSAHRQRLQLHASQSAGGWNFSLPKRCTDLPIASSPQAAAAAGGSCWPTSLPELRSSESASIPGSSPAAGGRAGTRLPSCLRKHESVSLCAGSWRRSAANPRQPELNHTSTLRPTGPCST